MKSDLRASAMELVLLMMLRSDSALSLDEALLRLRVLVAGPISPVGFSAKSLHLIQRYKRRIDHLGLHQLIILGLLLLAYSSSQGTQCTSCAGTQICSSAGAVV